MNLLEHYETLPVEVQKVLLTFDDPSWDECDELLEKLKPLGYTFDYDLSGEPYNLRLIDNSFEDLVFEKEEIQKEMAAIYCEEFNGIEDFDDIDFDDDHYWAANDFKIFLNQFEVEIERLKVINEKISEFKKGGWLLTEEVLSDKTWFCVSNGSFGQRSISYDYETEEEALNELEILNQNFGGMK